MENDARVHEALCTILATARDQVLGHDRSNAEDALAGWLEQSPDVVILNINMPSASGNMCAPERSTCVPSVQFLMYTMHEDDQSVLDALKAGANGYLLKSAKPMEILIGIRDLLTGSSLMSGPIGRRVVAQLRPTRQAEMPPVAKLTKREQEILQLLAEGLLYKEISLRIGISGSAVKQHIHRMYGKLQVQNRTEAVNLYFRRWDMPIRSRASVERLTRQQHAQRTACSEGMDQ